MPAQAPFSSGWEKLAVCDQVSSSLSDRASSHRSASSPPVGTRRLAPAPPPALRSCRSVSAKGSTLNRGRYRSSATSSENFRTSRSRRRLRRSRLCSSAVPIASPSVRSNSMGIRSGSGARSADAGAGVTRKIKAARHRPDREVARHRPIDASVSGLRVCEEHWSENPWIPASAHSCSVNEFTCHDRSRFMDSRWRGNDSCCLNHGHVDGIIPAGAGMTVLAFKPSFPRKRESKRLEPNTNAPSRE